MPDSDQIAQEYLDAAEEQRKTAEADREEKPGETAEEYEERVRTVRAGQVFSDTYIAPVTAQEAFRNEVAQADSEEEVEEAQEDVVTEPDTQEAIQDETEQEIAEAQTGVTNAEAEEADEAEEDDGLDELTVDDLKDRLHKQGKPVSGNKDELVARLRS